MKPRNLVLIRSGNSIVVNRATDEEIDESISADIVEAVKQRWHDEYKPLESQLLSLDRRLDMEDWRKVANQITDLIQNIRDQANRMNNQ